jgi:hypothetical protein
MTGSIRRPRRFFSWGRRFLCEAVCGFVGGEQRCRGATRIANELREGKRGRSGRDDRDFSVADGVWTAKAAVLPPRSGQASRRTPSLVRDLVLKESEVFRFPTHGVVDAGSPTGVIIENPFFDGAGTHLAVFTEVNGTLGGAVGLTAGV